MFEDWHRGHWFTLGFLLVILILVVILGTLGILFGTDNDTETTSCPPQKVSTDCSTCRQTPEVVISYLDHEIVKEVVKTVEVNVPRYALPFTPVVSKRTETPPLFIENNFPDGSVESKILKNVSDSDVLKSLNQQARHERVPSRVVNVDDIALQKDEDDLLEFLPVILYMNLDPRSNFCNELETQMQQLSLPEDCRLMRLCSEKKKENAWDDFLSHTTAMAKAISMEGNVLIVEDSFVLDANRKDLLRIFRNLPARWDVLVFAQDVTEIQPWQDTFSNWIRVIHNNNKCAYLVNQSYLPKLVSSCFKSFRSYNRSRDSQMTPFSLLSVFQTLQKSDLWLAHTEAIGHERKGHRERLEIDKQSKIFPDKSRKPVKVHPVVSRQKVAVCTVARGQDQNQAMEILFKDLHMNFLKMHHVEVFLYTDKMEFFHDMDKDIELHKIHLTHEATSPFHLVWNLQDMLSRFDYIFYLDPHYRIIDVVDWQLSKLQTLCAVEDLVNVSQPKKTGQLHVGLPELNPASQAYISPEEEMFAYYSERLWGGRRKDVFQLCSFILEAAAADQQKKVIPRKGFESYFNRYLLSHPPSLCLSVSFNFPESYMDPHCKDNLCKRFKELRIRPIMTWKE